jgi:hypothetical protein
MIKKPYILTKKDAVALQQHCREIRTILDNYSITDPDKPDHMTTVRRIVFDFNEFSHWVDIAAHIDSK